MRKTTRLGALGGIVCALLACSYDPEFSDDVDVALWEYPAVRDMEPQGPEFNRGLRQGYLDFGDELYEWGNFVDFGHFAYKAVDSAKGEMVLPDQVGSRSIPSDRVDELSAGRARLMAALDRTARKKDPSPAAEAQVAFDCWLERTEEGHPSEAEACKGRFETAMTEIERGLIIGSYIVFFAWDQADLTPVTQSVLDQVRDDFALGRPSVVVLGGHADRSGSLEYNEGLSEQRARNVARALVQRGLPETAMDVQWFGERQPRVPTPDGVREPQNRRVEIVFG